MKIMKYLKTILISTAVLLTASCQKGEGTGLAEEETVSIRVTASLPEVKSESETELGVDLIYLHAIDEYGTIITTTPPDSYSGNTYNYTVPADTYFMVFSNLLSHSSGDDCILSFNDETDFNHCSDVVTGSCFTSEIDDNGSITVRLERKVSKLTADVVILDYSGTPVDIHDYMIYAGIEIYDVYDRYIFNNDFSTTYSGEFDTGMTGTETSGGQMTYKAAENISFYPTIEGNNASIRLWMQCYNNQWYDFNTTLGYPFEANKHYKLTINVRMGKDGFGFILDDVITEEINVDLN